VTESPLLLKTTGAAKLEGKKALREYFARALAAAKHPVHMTPTNLLAEGDVAILEYEREAPHGGHPAVAERFVIRDGKIVESRIFWSADKIKDSFAG
jgi:ketosteroid isomerase-like protein